jgi:hypothetical protein
MASSDLSDAIILKSNFAFTSTSSFIFCHNSESKSFHFINPYDSFKYPGGILSAINPASIGIVPEPHIPSINSDPLSQPLSKIIPAASASFNGAAVDAVLYPRLCSESPELSSEIVQVSLKI